MLRNHAVRVRIVSVLVVLASCLGAWPSPAAGDDKSVTATTPGTQQLTFDLVLDRIRRAEASGAWRQPGWSDPVIVQGLTLLAAEVDGATPNHDVKLPVALAGLAPANPAGPAGGGNVPMLQNALLVARDISVAHANGCLLLADGNARVSHATGCVIVARGAVYIAHGRNNVVVAGHYIHSSFDGDPQRMNIRAGGAGAGNGAAPAGSLLVSGGVIDVSHAFDSVCSAHELVRMSNANWVAFLNCPKVEAGGPAPHLGGQGAPEKIQGAKLSVAPPAPKNPLAEAFRMTQVVHRDDARDNAAIIEHNGVELVVRPGAEVKDGRGEPIRGAEGWRLSFVGPDFALFSNGTEDAGFFVDRRRRE